MNLITFGNVEYVIKLKLESSVVILDVDWVVFKSPASVFLSITSDVCE